jgi:hypothetical protein
MKERSYEEILKFFQEVLKIEIDGGIWMLNKRLDRIKTNHKSINALKKWNNQQYDDLLKISQMDEENINLIKRIIQDSVSTAFLYFFKRLEEGENIEIGERINFELTAVNEETGQKTKLISATPDEDGIDNKFQEWIMDNCSKFPIK